MAQSDKSQVIQGAFWKFAERIAAQLVSLVVSIILARLLSPSEYGTISLVMVFITIANVFVSSGFGQALIQKKDADSLDFSSVFYFSLFFTGIIYVCLFFLAVPIANFYNMPILLSVLRVLAISVPIMGVNSVQQAYVARKMQFKLFFNATLIGTLISAVVGIVLAYSGYGVWALVAQTLTNNIIDTVILQITINWKLTREFSFERIKILLSYGWKLLLQSLILQFYASLRSLLIGKFYTTEDLSFYTKGNQFPELISSNIDTGINTALFPVMSKAQDSISRVKAMARKTTDFTSYVMSPILIGFMAIAEPFISLILTDKWLPCIPYLRICCIILLFRAPQTAILQAIKAVGRSDTVLKVDVPIRIFAIMILLISLKHSVYVFAISEIVVTLFGTILYMIVSEKIIDYTYNEVCRDFLINVLLATIMGIVVFFIGKVISLHPIIIMFFQISTGAFIYILLSILTKSRSYLEIKAIIFKIIFKYKTRIKQ
ncbi:lipopolysaccharide biosynthesis protein [Holdemanella biformis]|uniref:Lipopolysaccharide biosynthesis protein n=1 Tax=Holdemanella porci TaxID=2652276 RepID=A0A6N7VHF1_9FIRM|nr:lipopolysaccharide biosynthesis protein [Holdemanella porci]MSS57231.1 lipopolysaccharide biosynthesis protein [Holdemanella porci]